MAEIRTAHASTVNAAVRREGEWQSLSYSHQLGFGARRTAVASLRDLLTEFCGLCSTLAKSSPEAAELLGQADRLMIRTYEDLLKKMQLAGITLYRDQLQQDQIHWMELSQEWGGGPGYRERVVNRQDAWFDQQSRIDIESEIRTVLDREWKTVLGRVASIFEVD
jgi:hypothetical protein